MKYFFILIISCPLFALVYGDRMQIKILKTYEGNYLVLNRGVEDGIFKGEHVKITNDQGYVSRAICIKPRMQISHCKIYRVVNPELFSLDFDYTLSSIKQSEIPEDLKMLRDIDYSKRYNDFTDKDVNKALEAQNERLVNFDLINDFKKEDLAPRDSATETQALIDKNFDQKKLTKDLDTFKLTAIASPLSFQKQGGAYSQDLGLKLENNGEKYDFGLSYTSRKNKIVNQYTGNSVSQSTTDFLVSAELKDFSDDISATSFVQSTSQEFDGIKTPFNSLKISPIGAKFYISKSDDFKSHFSYSALFERTRFDSIKANQTVEKNFIRHRIFYSLSTSLNSKTVIDLTVDLQPELTLRELNTRMDAQLDFKILEQLSLRYSMAFITNSLIQDNYDLENTDLINSLNLNYSIDL